MKQLGLACRMAIEVCTACGYKVLILEDGVCPSCKTVVRRPEPMAPIQPSRITHEDAPELERREVPQIFQEIDDSAQTLPVEIRGPDVGTYPRDASHAGLQILEVPNSRIHGRTSRDGARWARDPEWDPAGSASGHLRITGLVNFVAAVLLVMKLAGWWFMAGAPWVLALLPIYLPRTIALALNLDVDLVVTAYRRRTRLVVVATLGLIVWRWLGGAASSEISWLITLSPIWVWGIVCAFARLVFLTQGLDLRPSWTGMVVQVLVAMSWILVPQLRQVPVYVVLLPIVLSLSVRVVGQTSRYVSDRFATPFPLTFAVAALLGLGKFSLPLFSSVPWPAILAIPVWYAVYCLSVVWPNALRHEGLMEQRNEAAATGSVAESTKCPAEGTRPVTSKSGRGSEGNSSLAQHTILARLLAIPVGAGVLIAFGVVFGVVLAGFGTLMEFLPGNLQGPIIFVAGMTGLGLYSRVSRRLARRFLPTAAISTGYALLVGTLWSLALPAAIVLSVLYASGGKYPIADSVWHFFSSEHPVAVGLGVCMTLLPLAATLDRVNPEDDDGDAE